VGSYLADLADDGVTMFANLPDGVYDFDDTPSVAVSTSRSQDKNCAQEMFEDNLYFKNKNSMVKYDGTGVTSVGYDENDGLPSDKIGETTALCSSWKFLFAAVKGATYSHILSKVAAGAWEYYARVPTPGLWVKRLFLSDSPDAIDRLWVIYGNHGYPGYFLNPMVNPLQAATYAYVPTGHFTYPIYGGDMPEEGGAFFDAKYSLGGMGGSNIMTVMYGLNGATPVTTLGVVASNNFSHVLGSPYGVEGNRIQPKFILAGANSGTTSIFKQAVFHYLKDPDKRSTFDFSIDIDRSSQTGVRSREAVIGSLNHVLSKKTLFPFYYGQMGTRHVKVLDMPFDEASKNEQLPLPQQREGIVQIRLAEIL